MGAVFEFDLDGALDQHRASGHNSYGPSRGTHGLTALTTTSSSVRRPGVNRPVSSNQLARAAITGPNAMVLRATTLA